MTAHIQVCLLGTPTIHCNQMPVTLGARAQALLYYLIATGQPQTRPALAGLLWGESAEDLARMSLRKTLVDLRKALSERVEADYQTVAFNASGCQIDLVEFSRVAHQAATLDLAQLRAGLDCYQGDFLTGFFLRNAPEYEGWLLNQRAYYRELALSAWQMLAQRHGQRGDHAQAIDALRRVLLLEPWREDAHRWLMYWLAQSDQRAVALAQFERCRRQLAGELAAEPNAETVALYEAIRTGQLDRLTNDKMTVWGGNKTDNHPLTSSPAHPVTPSPARPLTESPPHNLPPQTTPFIGRQQEVADVRQRLADPACRLLTLVGPGGMGKTRLAVEVARRELHGPHDALSSPAENLQRAPGNPAFADGIFFVPLAAVSSPSAAVAAIAEALAITFASNLPAQQELLAHLTDKQLLLVLDNFEHLLAAVDLVVDLLHAAPAVKLLVTARELLNLHEEWLYPVGGLEVPTSEEADAAVIATYDAVRLFVQNAQRARAGFDLAAEWRCVLRICRLVGGMPLGIELAATWLKHFSCAQIADEIAHNLDFLSTRLHNLPERHRSMRAVFEHSWQLLTPDEQQVVRRLAVLRGFCQDGAAAVAGASFTTLTALVEKSLVQVVRSEGHGRYVLHELLRQFAEEKLQADAAEQAMIRARQRAYYLARLAEEAGDLTGVHQRAALTTLGEESENIRTAWLWAAQQGAADDLEQRLDDLYAFYTASHRYQEGVELFETTIQALRQATIGDDDWLVRKLRNRLGGLYASLGRQEEAQALLSSGLAVAQALGMERESAFCLRILGEDVVCAA